MKSTIFGDKKKLLRQTIAAWSILLIGTIFFTATSILLSFFTTDSQLVILFSTLLIVPLLVVIHLYLQRSHYRLYFLRDLIVRELSGERGSRYDAIKRVIDLMLVLHSILLVWPLFLVIALLIKFESPHKPVIFTKLCIGKNGKSFNLYNFRTMMQNTDELKPSHPHLDKPMSPDFDNKKDPRFTPLGGFLQRTGLSELPRLLNVLKGEMSLVGPRPMAFVPDIQNVGQTERMKVLPGLISLGSFAQLAPNEEDIEHKRLQLDLVYVKHRSLRLDFLILSYGAVLVLGMNLTIEELLDELIGTEEPIFSLLTTKPRQSQ